MHTYVSFRSYKSKNNSYSYPINSYQWKHSRTYIQTFTKVWEAAYCTTHTAEITTGEIQTIFDLEWIEAPIRLYGGILFQSAKINWASSSLTLFTTLPWNSMPIYIGESTQDLQKMYRKFADFVWMRATLDPKGIFPNNQLAKSLGWSSCCMLRFWML